MSAPSSRLHGPPGLIAAVVAAIAIAAPSGVAWAEGPGPANTRSNAPQPGWDDDPIPPAPGPTPTPAPTPAPAPPPTVAPAAAPAPAQPPPQPLAPPSEAQRRSGNGMWIAAGITSGVGLLLNGARAYIVSGPCQTAEETGSCKTSWGLVTPFTMVLNVASIGLAGAGGGLRGRYDATVDPDRHAGRRPVLVTVGASMLAIGLATSITIRTLWFADWVSPQGPESFDFAKTGHAFGYYGGLQLSSMSMAIGIAMLVYGTARPRRAPTPTAKRRGHMMVMPSGMGLQLVGKF
jgi:hypothetical protein